MKRVYASKRKAWPESLPGHHTPWSRPEEELLIFGLECGRTRRDIAEQLGRTINAVGTHMTIMRNAGRL